MLKMSLVTFSGKNELMRIDGHSHRKIILFCDQNLGMYFSDGI